jgi:hypothetical protein
VPSERKLRVAGTEAALPSPSTKRDKASSPTTRAMEGSAEVKNPNGGNSTANAANSGPASRKLLRPRPSLRAPAGGASSNSVR